MARPTEDAAAFDGCQARHFGSFVCTFFTIPAFEIGGAGVFGSGSVDGEDGCARSLADRACGADRRFRPNSTASASSGGGRRQSGEPAISIGCGVDVRCS